MNPDLELALELADAADAVTMRHFRSAKLEVETKPDLSPVTEADRAVEDLIVDRLEHARPDDAVLGEEFGEHGTGAGRRWIIDPIDGTKNYVRGIGVFATLIALEDDGVVSVGIVSAPALGRRWHAARGDGAYRDGERVHVSDVGRLADALLLHASLDGWERIGRLEAFLKLSRACQRDRGYGDFWQHMLVAQGSAEIALEAEVSLWDMAAVQVIVEEAGGRLTDLTGAVTAAGGNAISTNGLLHDEALAVLNSAGEPAGDA
jgi:histidinol-phosphatase